MRIFPRIRRPSLKPVAQRLRRLRRHLSAPRIAMIVESVIFGGVLLLTLTGARAAYIDSFGQRADLTFIILKVK